MRVLVFLATATAVGLSSFAANAAGSDRAPSMIVAKQIKQTEAKTSKANAAAKSVAVKPAKAVVAKAAGKAKRVKARLSRKGVEIDTMTTASIVKPSTDGKAYGEIVSRYASAYGVPTSLAHAVIKIESNYRADARGSAGEIGLMQIKPATARMMGYSGPAQGLFSPETNIKYGIKYLAMAHKLGGGSTCATILRYNAGHAAKRMNPVSAAYCSKVKQHLAG